MKDKCRYKERRSSCHTLILRWNVNLTGWRRKTKVNWSNLLSVILILSCVFFFSFIYIYRRGESCKKRNKLSWKERQTFFNLVISLRRHFSIFLSLRKCRFVSVKNELYDVCGGKWHVVYLIKSFENKTRRASRRWRKLSISVLLEVSCSETRPRETTLAWK